VAEFREPQVVLFSTDVTRSAAFYASLGFEEVFRTPVTGEPIHVDLVLDGYRIGIASVDSTRDDHGLDPVATGQRAAVVLWTEDVRSAHAELVAAGVPGLKEPQEWLGRLLIAWLADPDGNPVQIVQPLSP
jgi:catechol 2,3-dioxygenase-like lactoylglutathione lyase family enzyme